MFHTQCLTKLGTLCLLFMSMQLPAQEPAPPRYETMVEDLLRDSIARETVHGLGQVPAYAEF